MEPSKLEAEHVEDDGTVAIGAPVDECVETSIDVKRTFEEGAETMIGTKAPGFVRLLTEKL
jgi:hypothetical protein